MLGLGLSIPRCAVRAGDALTREVASILAKYGTDAHVYLPGIGVINGLTAGNYLDSAGTTAATVDNPVGLVLDANGNSIARRNLLTYSEVFSNAIWTKTALLAFGSGSIADAITAPDGTLTADKIVENTAVGVTHGIDQDFTPKSGATYTASVYLKAAERGFAFIGFTSGSMATTFISVNLSTGAISTATGTPLASSTTSVGNGWYRVSISLASTGTTTSQFDIRLSPDGVWANRTYTGDGTSGIYLWGAQLEVGSTASEYQAITAGTGEWATGIHALQATTANKPILRKGAVNLLTYSEAIENALWTKTGSSISGTDTLRTITTATVGHAVYQSKAVTAGEVITFSFYAKRGTMPDAKYSAFDLSNGANIVSSTSYYSQINASTESRVSFTFTVPAGCSSVLVYLVRDSGVTGTIFAGKAQFETGSTASTYAPTTTASASNLVGGYHWVSDSTDVLTATFPAGYESVTIIDTPKSGQVTLTAQNIVGAYNIGPSIDTYGRFVFRTGLTASELAIVQQYCNRLAGV